MRVEKFYGDKPHTCPGDGACSVCGRTVPILTSEQDDLGEERE